jgi:rod shape-determining protein MreB
MIVNMGGGTSEIAVISLDGIVKYDSLRVAGDAINDSIITYMRKKKGVLIGEQTAEKVKFEIGSVLEMSKPLKMEVRGRDVGAGVPKSIIVTSNDIAQASKEPLRKIIRSIKAVLEQTPPELSADIIDRGMVLSGGTAQLRGIDSLVAKATGVPAYVADDPIYCVAKGTGIALELISSGKRVFVFEKTIT